MSKTPYDDITNRRRKAPTNRWGCKPSEDVCLQHCMPLMCRHGCEDVKTHKCKEREEPK